MELPKFPVVFSCILAVIFGIAAVVFGIIGIRKKDEYTTGKAAAIVMSVAGILVGIIVFLVAGLLISSAIV